MEPGDTRRHAQDAGPDDTTGVRVPRTVSFHPLPPDVVTIYPEWRGYEYFLVNDRIVVVDPRTLEIVDVIDV